MKPVTRQVRRTMVLAIAQAAACGVLFAATPCLGAEHRDILWDTISTCIDTNAKDYCAHCSAPRVEIDCRNCRDTTQVWAESREFVVIRDRKMCDCPDGFVHGLAIPRNRITGVEDPERPDGIWQFAWDVAVKRLNENEAALAVNPKRERSQDQLHVHIVRVRRESLPAAPGRVARVGSLDRVWYAAARKAAELDWKDYGVLVVRGENDYLVIVDDASPEYKYTRAKCR